MSQVLGHELCRCLAGLFGNMLVAARPKYTVEPSCSGVGTLLSLPDRKEDPSSEVVTSPWSVDTYSRWYSST